MKRNSYLWVLLAGAMVLAPAVSFAASNGMSFEWVTGSLSAFDAVLKKLLPILISLAIILFVWGLVIFIFNSGGDEKAKGEGKQKMIWGIVAIFVMVSIWGFVSILRNVFGITDNTPFIPNLPSSSSGSSN